MANMRYQIKATLTNIRPPIWRRLLVPADCTMDALHCTIQTAMGWTDTHLYAFRTTERRIEIPDPDDMWDAEVFDPDPVHQALANWKPNQASFMCENICG